MGAGFLAQGMVSKSHGAALKAVPFGAAAGLGVAALSRFLAPPPEPVAPPKEKRPTFARPTNANAAQPQPLSGLSEAEIEAACQSYEAALAARNRTPYSAPPSDPSAFRMPRQ
jgi:hypothetical protein